MPHVTPKKRKAEVFYPDEAADTSDVSDIQGEAIDWQDEDLIIGPTPQKNGRVLGLFDNLSPERLSTATDAQHTIATDEKESLAGPGQKTRKKVNKTPLKTPSFLRKRVLSVEESEDAKTSRLLFPAMPKRGLSMLISELREIEDNYEDEGMDVLREMEANFPRIVTETEGQAQEGEVEPLSHQGTIENEKVKWKKKGLKRTHRRVIMRPTGNKKKVQDGGDSANVAQEHEEAQDSDEYINSEDEAADAQAALGRPSEPTSITSHSGDTSQAISKTISAKKSSRAPKAGGISHNYKSLKLRNTGAKGGSRFGRGKFGGRR